MESSLAQRIVDVFSSRSDVDVAALFDRPAARTLNGPRFVIEGDLERQILRYASSAGKARLRALVRNFKTRGSHSYLLLLFLDLTRPGAATLRR